MNQLRRDIRRRIRERLAKWVTDSHELYQMADLEDTDAASDIISVMAQMLAGAIAVGNIPEGLIINLIRRNVEADK